MRSKLARVNEGMQAVHRPGAVNSWIVVTIFSKRTGEGLRLEEGVGLIVTTVRKNADIEEINVT